MSESNRDIRGAIFKAQWSGVAARHELERDDGRAERLEDASNYFTAPRNNAERELLDKLEEPIVDLAAGAGAYTLYLQEKGLRGDARSIPTGFTSRSH